MISLLRDVATTVAILEVFEYGILIYRYFRCLYGEVEHRLTATVFLLKCDTIAPFYIFIMIGFEVAALICAIVYIAAILYKNAKGMVPWILLEGFFCSLLMAISVFYGMGPHAVPIKTAFFFFRWLSKSFVWSILIVLFVKHHKIFGSMAAITSDFKL